MRVVHSLQVLGLLGASLAAASAGCGGGDTGTSTDGVLLPQPGLAGGTGGTATPPVGGVGSVPVLPSNPVTTVPAGQVTMVAPSLCSTQSIDAYGATPDMMIVFDRSLSMTLNNRWEPSKNAIRTITTEFDRLISFGLTMFPGSGATDPNQLI